MARIYFGSLVFFVNLPVVENTEWITLGDLGLHSKCGVVVSAKNEGKGPGFTPAMLRSGVSAGLAWHTDWGTGGLKQGFTLSDYGNAKSVPQFWGARIYQFSQVQAPNIPIMLGFNEPDLGHSGGSNIDIARALDLWMENVANARDRGYDMFVAPSIAKSLPSRYTGSGREGSDWLPKFLQSCLSRSGCSDTITFLGFHMYEPNCPTSVEIVQRFNMNRVNSLKKLAEDFNQRGMKIRGLWLTEFAGRSGKSNKCRTLAQQRGWMETIVPMLNAEPAVIGYSWFSYGEGRSAYFKDNANLWNYNDGTLNELGKAYFQLCSQHAATSGSSWMLPLLAILGLCALLAVAVFLLRRHSDKLSCSDLLYYSGTTCQNCCSRLRALFNSVARSPGISVARNDLEVDLQSLRSEQPALAKDVDDCCELLKDPSRFANESEKVFASLRRNITACSSDALDSIPSKKDIWRFILQVAERRIYRRQASALAKTLESRARWAKALNSDSELLRRRRALDS